MRILIVIALAIAGFLLGFLFWQISEKSSAGTWEKLLAVPNEVVALIPAGDPPLYIKTADGTTYHYEEWRHHGWVEAAVPETPVDPTEVQQPCDLSAPEFSRWSNPPHDLVDCFQARVMYADGSTRYTFVLDKHGDLWQSSITRTADDSLNALLSSLGFGLLAGLATGIFVAVSIRSQNVTEQVTITKQGAA